MAASLGMLLLYALSSIVVPQPVALAHAFVIGSDPVDGSTVPTAPSVVRIYFDAPISPASAAYVYSPQEQIVNASHSIIPKNNPRELDTPLKNPSQLPLGSYTVRWTALADEDGHTTHGVIGFNIGQSSTGLPGVTILGPSTSNILPTLDLLGILLVAWEWLVLLALVFWIGILIAEGIVLNGVERAFALLTRARKQAQPLGWLCLAALLVGEVITLVLRATQFSQSLNGNNIDFSVPGQILTRSTYGSLWLARIALLLVAAGFLWWTSRQRDKAAKPARRYTITWLALAGLLLLTYALSSDAAQLAQPHISAIILDWLYLAALCTWLGGLAYLGYILLPLLPTVEPDRRAETLTTLLRRLQPLMLSAVGVLLVSGFYLSEVSLTGIQQFITEPYGRTLLVQWALIAIMIAITVYVFFVLRPKLARQATLLPVVNAELPARRVRQSAFDQVARSLKQLLNVQSWFGAGVLLCLALMAFFAPPIVFPNVTYTQYPAATRPAAGNIITQTKQAGNLSIMLAIVPGKAGRANTIIVTLLDVHSGNPVTNAQVQVATNMVVMNMGNLQASMKGGNATYTATFPAGTAFSMGGLWQVALRIQRPGQKPLVVVFQIVPNTG